MISPRDTNRNYRCSMIFPLPACLTRRSPVRNYRSRFLDWQICSSSDVSRMWTSEQMKTWSTQSEGLWSEEAIFSVVYCAELRWSVVQGQICIDFLDCLYWCFLWLMHAVKKSTSSKSVDYRSGMMKVSGLQFAIACHSMPKKTLRWYWSCSLAVPDVGDF